MSKYRSANCTDIVPVADQGRGLFNIGLAARQVRAAGSTRGHYVSRHHEIVEKSLRLVLGPPAFGARCDYINCLTRRRRRCSAG